MTGPETLQYYESTIEHFAEVVFDRQLHRFYERFGRIPKSCDPVFFQPEPDVPAPMCPPEILALVTGEAMADTHLDFTSEEGARVFAILVLMRLGLSTEDAEEALTQSGVFALQ